MNILVVTPSFLPVIGGAELGIYELYKRIGRRHNVTILTRELTARTKAAHVAVDPSLAEGLQVERFWDVLTTAKLPCKNYWYRWLAPLSFSYIIALRRAIKASQPDLINIHNIFPAVLALLHVRRYYRIPVVLSLVGRTDVFGRDNPLFQSHYSLMNRAVRSASATTALTNYMLAELTDRSSTTVIPYGADVNLFRPDVDGDTIRSSLGIAPDTPILLTVQRLVALKNIDVLIRTMLRLRDLGLRACLVIGGIGPEDEALRRLTNELGINEMVRFAGFIAEQQLPLFYAAAKLFLFSSKHETFGVVLAQALASGKPIVAYNSSCVSEVITNGREGLLLASLDEATFADAIASVLSAPDYLAKLSENARKRAVQDFDWERIAAQYEELFLRCVASES